MSLKDRVINILADHPVIGVTGTGGGLVLSVVETITTVAQCVGAVCGAFIAVLTLYSLHKKMKKKKDENNQ